MYDHNRRRVLHWVGAGLTAPVLGGCATTQQQVPARGTRTELELLYFADTLDQREARRPSLPDTHVGPARYQGRAPWLRGRVARQYLQPRQVNEQVIGWFDGNRERPVGGYAQLTALLEQCRRESRNKGIETLTLENGQCWNGSGLAYVTNGESGLWGSRLLGSEFRVSSNERTLWPERAEALYRSAAVDGPVTLSSHLTEGSKEALSLDAYKIVNKAGVRIAVVAATDPYATDEQRSLSDWFEPLQQQLKAARQQADLVLLLADVGTGPALWLSEHADSVDLVLAARGQDLWPLLIETSGQCPVCLPGSGGMGVFRVGISGGPGAWQFKGEFLPADGSQLDAESDTRLPVIQQALDSQRQPHSAWLDQPLAQAPHDLWRRDLFAGGWDQLIHAALGTGDNTTNILPGWRYDAPLKAGEWIRREHLLMLTGSAEARLARFSISEQQLKQLLEQSAEQLWATPMLLDTSKDMPRVPDFDYRLDYGKGPFLADLSARRSDLAASRFNCQTLTTDLKAQGTPLWQLMELYLRDRLESESLPVLPRPDVRFVEGHPGWGKAASA